MGANDARELRRPRGPGGALLIGTPSEVVDKSFGTVKRWRHLADHLPDERGLAASSKLMHAIDAIEDAADQAFVVQRAES